MYRDLYRLKLKNIRFIFKHFFCFILLVASIKLIFSESNKKITKLLCLTGMRSAVRIRPFSLDFQPFIGFLLGFVHFMYHKMYH